MKVYLDTGIFVDYLIFRGHAGIFLRKQGRRNRTIQDLSNDALDCFNKIKNTHEGLTSSLTLYEIEESMYQELNNSSKGIDDKIRFNISSSRCLIAQILFIIDYYNFKTVDLTKDIIINSVQEIDLQFKGIRSADSLHILTAIKNNADLLISADNHLIKLNEVFKNQSGIKIKCMDSNDARRYL